MIRKFITLNRKACKWLDSHFLSEKMIVDGNRDYIDNIVIRYIANGMTIYDIGGGKQPFFSANRKQSLGLRVVGLDISSEELNRAPPGAYDRTLAIDIAKYIGSEDGDVVICQAVLEHVQDTSGAIKAISTILKPSGKALIFVPCRNAIFARLNLVLPQALKRLILHSIYPSTSSAQGFPSFYNHCTPVDFRNLAKENGLSIESTYLYYKSSYFEFFVPLYIIWRATQWLLIKTLGQQGAETFTMILEKPPREEYELQ